MLYVYITATKNILNLIHYLKKVKESSKCEAQNMPGEASIILASSFILLHTMLEPLPQTLKIIASDLEQ